MTVASVNANFFSYQMKETFDMFCAYVSDPACTIEYMICLNVDAVLILLTTYMLSLSRNFSHGYKKKKKRKDDSLQFYFDCFVPVCQ